VNEFASIVTALALLVTSVGTVINGRRIKDVKHEVKTGNSQTLAQLADARESRRIDEIPLKDRTKIEKSHVKEMEE
jgi:hypothetical protein